MRTNGPKLPPAGLPPRPSLGRAVREPRMHHRPQRTRTGNPRPTLPPSSSHPLSLRRPWHRLPPKLESGGKEPTPERVRARELRGRGGGEKCELCSSPLCMLSRERIQPALPVFELFSHRPTPRDPDKDAGAGQRQREEVRAGLTVSASRMIVELDRQRRIARPSWVKRVVRGQAGDERDATANRPRQKIQLSLYLFPRSPFGVSLKNKL